ncbi:MAG: alpha/beta hydrolase [Propionibacteriaceae bacterium]|nr:alpha/beta hydrolase [Propionibacteriaceae bacterium]
MKLSADVARRPRWRAVVVVCVVILLIIGALGTALVLGQRSLIYFPDHTDPNLGLDRAHNVKDVGFTTEDGLTLTTWLIGPTAASNGAAVLYLPGNAGNRSGRLAVAQDIAALGYTVLLVEYRGYGGNPGNPSEDGLAMDARAAVNFLNTQGFANQQIIYVGESIGTGVAARLASTSLPAAVLLRSPFTSMVDMGKHLYPWLPVGLILKDRFETMTYLPAITVPMTVLAGGADDFVPMTQSKTVADNAPDLFQFKVVDGVGHNDPIWFSPYLADQVDALAKSALSQ